MRGYELRQYKITGPSEIGDLFQRIEPASDLSPFQSRWFLSAFFAACCAQSDDELEIYTVELSAGGPILLALPVARTNSYGVRCAGTAGHDYCDICAPVVTKHFHRLAPGERDAAMQHLVGAIQSCDLLRLRNIPQVANGHDNPLFAYAGAAEARNCQYTMPLTAAPPQRETSRSVYKECGVKFRKLTEKGYDFREVTDSASKLSTISELLRLQQESFQLRGIPAPDPGQAETLYRHLVLQDDPHNRLHVLVISNQDGDIVSGAALIGGGNNVNGSLIGIAGPQWKRYSPGMVLIMKIRDWARERGYSYLNFGAGEQPYKEKFGAQRIPATDLVEPRSLLGKTYILASGLRRHIRTLPGDQEQGRIALITGRTTAMTAALQMDQAGYLVAL